MCLWAVDFPPTSLLPPIADPPRPGQSPQRLELGKLHPGHPLQWLSTWSHIKSLGGIREIRMPGPHSRPIIPALGRLGQGSLPLPEAPAAQPRWRSSLGGVRAALIQPRLVLIPCQAASLHCGFAINLKQNSKCKFPKSLSEVGFPGKAGADGSVPAPPGVGLRCGASWANAGFLSTRPAARTLGPAAPLTPRTPCDLFVSGNTRHEAWLVTGVYRRNIFHRTHPPAPE